MKYLFNHADQTLTIDGVRYDPINLLTELNMAYIRMRNYGETHSVEATPIEDRD